MTIAEAEAMLETVRRYAGVRDAKAAHAAEDRLWHEVLAAIAGGGRDARLLAKIAMATKAIHFDRWCA